MQAFIEYSLTTQSKYDDMLKRNNQEEEITLEETLPKRENYKYDQAFTHKNVSWQDQALAIPHAHNSQCSSQSSSLQDTFARVHRNEYGT